MDKILEYHYGDHDSEVFTLIDSDHHNKVAEYSEDIREFIDSLERKAKKTYALVNAMSAGEFYGSNRNGDYFPHKALREYHKTFEANGHVYKHHVNKDPRKAMGRVVFSHFNPGMNRVELVLELDDSKASPVIEKLNEGHLPAVSMGCKVPYDVCSVCGNKAKTLRQYCAHLKTKMNRVLDDGRRVFAINTRPKFFDLSVVTIPADSTAGFLAKLASAEEEAVTSSAELAEALKESAFESNADIKKKIDVPADLSALSKDPKDLVYASQARLDKKEIEKLSQFPLEEVMSTFLGLRIMPRRDDFQKLALYSVGKRELADELDRQHIVFSPENTGVELSSVSYEHFNEKVAGVLGDSVLKMSLTKPLVVSRVLEKVASEDPLEDFEVAIGSMDEKDKEALLELLRKHGILPKSETDVGWDKQIEAEPSQLKKMVFGHTPEPLLSPHKSPLLPLAGLGAAYTGYAKMMDKKNLSGFFKLVKKYPWLMPLVVGAGTLGSLALQESSFQKSAGAFAPSLLVSIPVSYLAAGKAEADVRRGKAITKTNDFLRKHPFLTALGLSGLASSGLRLIKRAELLSQMDNKSLNKLYNELIEE